jgi:tetratricopeptide (TPR) repeat protein
MVALSLGAGVAAIAAFFYVALIGQRTIIEWWYDQVWSHGRNADDMGGRRIIQNLPQRPYHVLVDRSNQLQECAAVLAAATDHLVSIVGLGGIGKTSLALEVAYRFLRDRKTRRSGRFDAIIWCSAKQYELLPSGAIERSLRVHTLDDVYRTIAVVLNRKDVLQVAAQDRDLMIRSLLSERRILLFVDNIETADDKSILSFLHSIPNPTRVLVTTRFSLDIGREIKLDGLSRDDAASLVCQEVRSKGGEYSEAIADEIYGVTRGVALATIWSAARAAGGSSAGSVRTQLERFGGDVVAFSFNNAVADIQDTSAYKVLLSLAMFATDADIAILCHVAGVSSEDNIEALRTLERRSIITRTGGRVSMLPLTRQFVGKELEKSPVFAKDARGRLYSTMHQYVKTYLGDDYWEPIRRWLQDDEIESEIENLLLCVEWADRDNLPEVALGIGGPLVHHLWRFGRVEERRVVSETCAAAAERLGNSEWQVWLLVDGVGYIYLTRREITQAQDVIGRGREVASGANFADGLALANAYLAELGALSGDLDGVDAMLAASEGEATLPSVKARVRAIQGNVAAVRNNWSLAASRYKEVVELRQASDGYEPPTQLAIYGLALARNHDFTAAIEALQKASDHARQTIEGRAYTHYGWARVWASRGNVRRAREECEAAVRLARMMGESRLADDIQALQDSL